MTSIETGTPLVSTSNTAERFRDCSTSLTQLLGRGVALHVEGHADGLVAVADLRVEPEDAVEVDVALDGGRHLGELDAAGGGDVRQPRGQAPGERVEQVLDRGGAEVGADEDRGVVHVVGEDVVVGALLADAEVPVDGALAVGAGDPAVGRPELELGRRRRRLHGVEGGEQGGGVDAVADAVLDGGHLVCLSLGLSVLLGWGLGGATTRHARPRRIWRARRATSKRMVRAPRSFGFRRFDTSSGATG